VILPNFDFGFIFIKRSKPRTKKNKKNLWESVWSRGGQPDSVCGPHLKKKLSKTQNIGKSLNSAAEISYWAAGWPPLVWRLKKQFSD
jgi:hypothetical protein